MKKNTWILLGTLLATGIVVATIGCSESKEKDDPLDASTDGDTDTDADTDTDTDTDSDTDTDTDTDTDPPLLCDLDCTNPIAGAGDACEIGVTDCDTENRCAETLWDMYTTSDNIIGHFCYVGCADTPFVSPDAGVDAGTCSDPAGCFCEGSASECIDFNPAGTIKACMPQGQFKANWEVNVVPGGDIVVTDDYHVFPIAESWNCQTLGFTSGWGQQVLSEITLADGGTITPDAGPDAGPWDETEYVLIQSKVNIGGLFPKLYRLLIAIPYANFTAGSTLDLGSDPGAFIAKFYRFELTPFGDIDAAELRAYAVGGTITIDTVEDPCGGAGCPVSTGTMDIDFHMMSATLDPADFS